MLVLNNLPNVQILNGRSTKDDEEDEEEEERESHENDENENREKNKNNHFFPQMEEIEEDKNMENNSNYVSNENNNLNNLNDMITNNQNRINGNNMNNNKTIYSKGNTNIPKLNLNEKKDIKNNVEEPTNSLLYDKIISNISNNNSKDNSIPNNPQNTEKNVKRESYYDMNNNNTNDKKNIANFNIDITNEELNLLKDEKYDKNYDFISFLKEFCDIFNSEEKDEENKIINIYLKKIKEVENKKNNLPNYYYLHLLQKKKMKILKTILDEIFPYILNKCPEINKNNILIKLNNEFLNSIKVTKDLIATLHMHIEAYNNKKEVNNNTNSNNDINEVIKEKNNITANLESQRDKILKAMNEDKISYEKKIESLEKENKIMTEKLLNKANNLNNSPSIDISNTTPTNKGNRNTKYKGKSINFRNNSQTPIKREKTKFETYNKHKRNKENNLSFNNNKTRSPIKSSEYTISLENNNNNTINYYLNTNNNFNISNANTSKHQLITLKALKDFINELYISKTNYDMKCIEFKLPKETLEEHMYTFLNEKYGLKNLIIDWARNIINGIKYYSKKDSYVLLFGKILRNEQEEEARFIIQKVSESIEELLLYYIKRQYPLKGINEINKIFERKKKSELFEEEWKGIIFSIYEKNEAEEIERKIDNFINKENEKKKLEMFKNYKDSRINNKRNKNNNFINTNHNNNNNINNSNILNTINSFNNGVNISSASPHNLTYMNTINNPVNTKMTRIEKYNMLLFPDERNILFPDFIKIVLDNHIRFRDKQLKNFVEIFKAVDTNRDGIISEEEFTELIQRMKIFKDDEIESKIFQYLERIDPFDNQKITFSECVSFFSEEIIVDKDMNGNEKEISILEKVCFNGEENENGHRTNHINNKELKDREQVEKSVNINNSINKTENNKDTGVVDK